MFLTEFLFLVYYSQVVRFIDPTEVLTDSLVGRERVLCHFIFVNFAIALQ